MEVLEERGIEEMVREGVVEGGGRIAGCGVQGVGHGGEVFVPAGEAVAVFVKVVYHAVEKS